jgi:hypothetical protein
MRSDLMDLSVGRKGESDLIFRTVSNDAEKWDVDTLWDASMHLMGSEKN